MKVHELMEALRHADAEAELRFLHLQEVGDDGRGVVESYPALTVTQGDNEPTVLLADFLCEDHCLYSVIPVEWEQQPALKAVPVDKLQDKPPPT